MTKPTNKKVTTKTVLEEPVLEEPVLEEPVLEEPVLEDPLITSTPLLPLGTFLRQGDRNDLVKIVQKAIGAKPDGVFGPFTLNRLKRWQLANGLPATGVVDHATVEKLG